MQRTEAQQECYKAYFKNKKSIKMSYTAAENVMMQPTVLH